MIFKKIVVQVIQIGYTGTNHYKCIDRIDCYNNFIIFESVDHDSLIILLYNFCTELGKYLLMNY